MGLLDALIFGVRDILYGTTPLVRRSRVAFTGSGVTVADDPTNDRTLVTVSGGGGGLPIVLTTDVSGVLPVANGGTGSNAAPAGGFAGLTAVSGAVADAEAHADGGDAATLAAAEAYTDAAVAGIGGSAVDMFSVVRIAEIVNASISNGNYTAGRKFWVIGDAISCTGLRFFHKSGGSLDFKCTLVDKDGTTVLESKTVTSGADGIVSVTWDGGPYTLTPSLTDFYRVMIYETSGTYYIHYTPPTMAHAQADSFPWHIDGAKKVWMGRSGYRGGDSPAGALSGNYYVFADGGEFYAVEPVFA